MSVMTFTPGARLNAAIAQTASRSDGVGFNVFLRAVADQEIALTAVTCHRTVWTPRSLKSSLPTIVIIGDDAGGSRDPAEWRSAMSAIAWARCAVVHGTGPQAFHYKEAVLGAKRMGRCLFIETDSAMAPAWAAAIRPRGIPCLLIIPPPGGVHPVLDEQGAVH